MNTTVTTKKAYNSNYKNRNAQAGRPAQHPTVRIFNDLDKFRLFCSDYGYVFNEADLYNPKKYSYMSFLQFKQGKRFVDNWARDAR